MLPNDDDSKGTEYVYIEVKDNAGNSMCDDKGPYIVKIYGRHSDCGAETYKTCATSGCGSTCNKCEYSQCGTKVHVKCWHYGYNCSTCYNGGSH